MSGQNYIRIVYFKQTSTKEKGTQTNLAVVFPFRVIMIIASLSVVKK